MKINCDYEVERYEVAAKKPDGEIRTYVSHSEEEFIATIKGAMNDGMRVLFARKVMRLIDFQEVEE